MRRNDKLKQIEKANLLVEQRYIKSKSLINEEDFSDGDADASAFEDYYKSIVGEEERFFSHFNTPKDALTAALSAVDDGRRNGAYYKPYILSGVLLAILSKVQ